MDGTEDLLKAHFRWKRDGGWFLKRVGILWSVISFGLTVPAQIILEGQVTLPAPKSAAASAARYQQKAGTVEPPEPPAAVVFLETSGSNGSATGTQAYRVEQKGYQFGPGLLPIPKGAAVEFPNRDDDYHHVFSYSKTKEFDIGRYRKTEQPPPVKFDKPGVVKIGCEIHDHMRGTILVLDTPYFVKTDSQGKYKLTIETLPPGQYVLKAWINERTLREQKLEIKGPGSMMVNFPGH